MRRPWTQQDFFAWAEGQEARFEFDGVQPVALPRGTNADETIAHNLYGAVRRRFPHDSPCRVLGPNAGVATVGGAVRYPDGVITGSKQDQTSRKVSDVLVLFEVINASTARTDRIIKVREYGAVASVRHYVLIESTLPGVTVLSRLQRGESPETWGTTALTIEDSLQLPELGMEIPVAELYRDVTFPGR